MESLTITISKSIKNLSLIFLNTSFLFLLSFYATSKFNSNNIALQTHSNGTILTQIWSPPVETDGDGCSAVHDYTDAAAKCDYVKSSLGCQPKGYINSFEIFYCNCGGTPLLGYALLLSWLVLLFYLMANTASDYFCPSVEGLTRTLNLSPTIAGATLLPLGNGANDVFSILISFTRSNDADVGLNSVLGGAFFTSSIIVGIICILVAPRRITLDKPSFVRDILFFLFSLSSLAIIIFAGTINLWAAIFFTSIYPLYICTVWVMHFFNRKRNRVVDGEMATPLLGCVDEEKYDELVEKIGSNDEIERDTSLLCKYLGLFLYVLEFPLYLTRRLTIPAVSGEKWSKPYAVISVILAPILLAILWNTQREKMGSRTSLVIYMTAVLVGIVLGNLAFEATKMSAPPNKCLLPWLAGGFLMSITWTYILAEELVSLLLSLGVIVGISPSLLGLTVLAWGNQMGDLISNVALAMYGGPDGVQIAVSGCYASPLFNTLVGLGLSFILALWSQYPLPYVIQGDPFLYEDIGFLIGGLLWSIVIFPKKNMRPDRHLGGGLLAIYLCFLFLKLARALGLLNLHGSAFFNLKEVFSFEL